MGLLPKLKSNLFVEDLIQAVRQGSVRDVARFLDRGADVNQRDEHGSSALTYAAAAGHLEIMDLLLEVGAHVEAEDTPLFAACCRTGLASAQLLYRFIPDAHTRNMFLVTAAEVGSRELVSFLAHRGADVSAADRRGWTALMMASMEGHLQVAQFLLEQGAQVNASDVYGSTALMTACQFGKHDVVELLIDHQANVNAKALASPVLLTKYSDPENWFPPGMTALSWACRNGHRTIVELLLEHGAEHDVRDGSGWTPLMWAALGGHTDIATALLAKGADPCARTRAITSGLFAPNSTSLIMAAHRGHAETMSALLDGGADIEAKDRDGKTALMFAARGGHLDAVRLLLDRGASRDEKNREGLSALAYAMIERHASVAEALREKGCEEPVVSKEAVSFADTVSIPSAARLDHTLGMRTVLIASGIILIAIAGLFLTHRDFSSLSLLEKETIGLPLSSFLGFMAWLASEQGMMLFVFAWAVAVGLVAVGFATLVTRWVVQTGQWDSRFSPLIGRAANLGLLAVVGSGVMLLVLCYLYGLYDRGDRPSLGIVYTPAYFICGGALVLAFIYCGRERFSFLKILGLSIVFFFGGFWPPMAAWDLTIGSSTRPLHLGLSAFVLLYMVLMVTVNDDSVIVDRSLLRMIARGILLFPVLIAAAVLLLAAINP